MSNHLYDGLLARGRTEPGRPFAELPDGRAHAYRDVEAASARYANVLAERGVGPGDRVAVQADKSIDALMLYLATLRAGGVFLPLNTAYTPAEVEYFLSDAEPRLFVCDPARSEALRPAAERSGARLETLGTQAGSGRGAGSLVEAGAEASASFGTVARGAEDLAAILYTSGTTGRSKGAMLSHGNLLSNAEVLRDAWRFAAEDVLLHILPIYHTHGLFVAINTVLSAGASTIFLPSFDPDAVFAHLPRATVMMGVPTHYTRLLADARLSRGTAGRVRLFISGSAPLLAETHRAFEARTGQRILERYGMTETNMNSSNPHDGERRAGTVGLPLPGTEIRVTDPETGEERPRGEIGMIEVRGPNVFAGYWRMPERTAAEFRPDGFFVTGDLGRFDADGYLTIVGRGKDLIISGGLNVYPKEVEAAIDEVPGVVESAVIGVPHADLGEAVVAAVVAGRPLSEGEVLERLRGGLARFKQPRRLVFVDELPRNAMGKVQKNLLRERYRDLLERDGPEPG